VRPRRVPMSSAGVADRDSRYPKSPSQPDESLLVQVYAWRGLMATSRIRPTAVAASSDCEAWPYLDEGVLRPSRSRKVCMTCHWFRHHAGAECIPVLTCQLHRGQIAQGEHLIRRCQGWTDDMVRQRGWAPEVG
jgi:hypothetical protein